MISPSARRCAARQLVGAGEYFGKTETRWRHCALAGTDQLAPQVIFDYSSGELARVLACTQICSQICLLSAHSIFSSAARARCDGASRRRKIYSRGRRAEKGFRYAPQYENTQLAAAILDIKVLSLKSQRSRKGIATHAARALHRSIVSSSVVI